MIPIIECIPNVSEGRSKEIVDALASVVRSVKGVSLLDQHRDPDHHRSVLTFAGEVEVVENAAFALVKAATERIHLDAHSGVHPRIGATDVLPFVPLRGATMEQCVDLARRLGARIGVELEIPVFLYEEASMSASRRALEVIRRGGLAGLADRIHNDQNWAPDYGPSALHPTAGAIVVGARQPLIAYNVLLDSNDLALARTIARTIRTSGGGLPSLKALGLALTSRGCVQVSMNLTNHRETPLYAAFEAVKREAAQRGVSILGSELVGLVPQEALIQVAAHSLQFDRLTADQVIESRLMNFQEF